MTAYAHALPLTADDPNAKFVCPNGHGPDEPCILRQFPSYRRLIERGARLGARRIIDQEATDG